MTRRFHAVDELDFYLHFLATGLWVEPDPEKTAALLPHLGPPRVRELRRYKQQGLTFLTSRTDPLDAWYLHQLGHRITPAPKPTANGNTELLTLVDAVTELGQPGWLAMSTTLREGDAATQRAWAQHGRKLCHASEADGQRHTMAVIGGTRPDNTFVVVWASRPAAQPLAQAREILTAYASAKKHQVRAARGFGLLFDALTGQLETSVFDNRLPGPDAALDALGQQMGLKPLDAPRSPLLPSSPRGGRRKKRR